MAMKKLKPDTAPEVEKLQTQRGQPAVQKEEVPQQPEEIEVPPDDMDLEERPIVVEQEMLPPCPGCEDDRLPHGEGCRSWWKRYRVLPEELLRKRPRRDEGEKVMWQSAKRGPPQEPTWVRDPKSARLVKLTGKHPRDAAA